VKQRVPPRPIHPFPARMAAAVVEEHLLDLPPGSVVLDPMVGSGTTLVLARTRGLKGIGVDTDPLALLLAETWSSRVDVDRAGKAVSRMLRGAEGEAEALSAEQSYPASADEETRSFIDYWFEKHIQKELRVLSTRIGRVRDPSVRRVLWTAFSRLVIVKERGVSLAMDIAHSRPHRVYETAPRGAVATFAREVKEVLCRAAELQDSFSGPAPLVLNADARALPLDSGAVDAVISSPPYLNAIDYLRGHKFSLVWMGHTISDLRATRAANIGTEVSWKGVIPAQIQQALFTASGELLPKRERGILARYLADMLEVLKEVRRVLRPGGSAALVVGDSRMHGIRVRNADALIALADTVSLELVARKERSIQTNRRYLPPPEATSSGASLGARMRSEWVLRFAAAS